MAVERLQGEAAGVDLAALVHELREPLVDEEMAGEGLVAELREAALDAERHAGAVEQDRGLVALPQQARRLSILTMPIEPSNATVWKVTSAFSPGRP